MPFTVGQSGVANYANTTSSAVTRVVADGGIGAGGEAVVASTPFTPGTQTFTTSGTFTVPVGTTTLIVETWGGGGGGSQGASLTAGNNWQVGNTGVTQATSGGTTSITAPFTMTSFGGISGGASYPAFSYGDSRPGWVLQDPCCGCTNADTAGYGGTGGNRGGAGTKPATATQYLGTVGATGGNSPNGSQGASPGNGSGGGGGSSNATGNVFAGGATVTAYATAGNNGTGFGAGGSGSSGSITNGPPTTRDPNGEGGAGGGGGGGATAHKYTITSSIPTSLTFLVGAAGTGSFWNGNYPRGGNGGSGAVRITWS